MKLKKVLAGIAILVLIGMYGATLIFALSDHPDAAYLFRASIFCTVFIPVLLYAYTGIYKLFDHRHSQTDTEDVADTPSDK